MTIDTMKYIVFAGAILWALAATAPVFAGERGIPNENSVGIGSFYLVRWGIQQMRHAPPLFLKLEPDRDGKVEGRADTFYMRTHKMLVDSLGNK